MGCWLLVAAAVWRSIGDGRPSCQLHWNPLDTLRKLCLNVGGKKCFVYWHALHCQRSERPCVRQVQVTEAVGGGRREVVGATQTARRSSLFVLYATTH